ncbi:hypothetical protein PHMEG_00027994 [Phytophthora megakarya]|uniref:Uncharacterized protein n=1 Tax=Phytophthora megakarya TaxID=4795 RepID=A0A225V767_9STRA|nr:hypothetical protein PHMEG_00027994 [Phytophthora megakarya]
MSTLTVGDIAFVGSTHVPSLDNFMYVRVTKVHGTSATVMCTGPDSAEKTPGFDVKGSTLCHRIVSDDRTERCQNLPICDAKLQLQIWYVSDRSIHRRYLSVVDSLSSPQREYILQKQPCLTREFKLLRLRLHEYRLLKIQRLRLQEYRLLKIQYRLSCHQYQRLCYSSSERVMHLTVLDELRRL